MQELLIAIKQKSPDPTTREGSGIGGSSSQIVARYRTCPRHLSKLRAPV